MTKRVMRYVEIGQSFTFDFVKNHKVEYERLCAEGAKLLEEMTLSELKSLEQLIPKREFHMGILPLIKNREAQGTQSASELVYTKA